MAKKKNHIDFCHELKAKNLKVTVLGIYKDYNSKIAVRCDKCGCEWSPRAGSLLHGHGCPKCAGVKLKSHSYTDAATITHLLIFWANLKSCQEKKR